MTKCAVLCCKNYSGRTTNVSFHPPSPSRSRQSSGRHAAGSSSSSKRRHRRSEERRSASKRRSRGRSSDSGSSSSGSSSSGSSSAGAAELRLLRRLEAERARLREQRRQEKEALKAGETAQEKRARRLREKAAKERRRRERMGWDAEYQGYTDQDNPFGDSQLTDTFVWGKKLQASGVRAVDRAQLERAARRRQLETKAELEKVKARRLEREAERAAREAEASAAARAREAALYSNWERHEDGFHLQQARLRTEIRIRDGRAQPIDLLAWYVAREHEADALEMHEPYTYLRGLGVTDLQHLLADIAVYRALEPGHGAYWDDVETIAKDELAALRRREGATGAGAGTGGSEAVAAGGARRDAVHRAVADDVSAVFRGKSADQLDALRRQVEAKLSRPSDNLDVTYWESLLGQLRAHQARARLRDRHQRNLRTKLQLLKRQQGVEEGGKEGGGAASEPEPGASCANPRETERQGQDGSPGAGSGGESDGDGEGHGSGSEAAVGLYRSGRYSPPPLSPRALEPGSLLTEPAADRQRLAYLRARTLHRLQPEPERAASGAGAAQAALERAAAEACAGPDSAPFAAEHPLPAEPCLWADKYRPRKPRYFNRVHTGFEWNKYNQTHYDMDNPPPKIVQGYKFNIFYPDLLQPGRTPRFSLQPVDDGQFAVLRFSAGPPYEDIAFKVVNREWEYSYKRGFRCHFHNNIFQLWFHFKRYRYRR